MYVENIGDKKLSVEHTRYLVFPFLLVLKFQNNFYYKVHKHSPEVIYKTSCSEKFRNTHRKTTVLESLFNTSSNHPPQVIKHIPISINKRLNKNSSSEEIFNESKSEYKTALKNSGYHKVELKFHKEEQNNQKIWFNPHFSRNVTTNVAKTFLNLLDKHFPKSNKLHKIFIRNTVTVSYCCTENVTHIIRSHNKNVINGKKPTNLKRNCRNKVSAH